MLMGVGASIIGVGDYVGNLLRCRARGCNRKI